MLIYTGAYWNRGQRSMNEDSLIIEDVSTDSQRILIAGVADGIGSLKEGHIASGYILERMVDCFYRELVYAVRKKKSSGYLKKICLKELEKISEELKEYGDMKGILLGSTLSLLIIHNSKYLHINIGDSATFLCRGKKFCCLSHFHCNADGSLSRCIGSFEFQKPYVRTGFIHKNTAFLISSDGFYRRLGKDCTIFRPKDIENELQIEKRLAIAGARLREKGEGDNASAVYIKLE